jgi:hypothetical protein
VQCGAVPATRRRYLDEKFFADAVEPLKADTAQQNGKLQHRLIAGRFVLGKRAAFAADAQQSAHSITSATALVVTSGSGTVVPAWGLRGAAGTSMASTDWICRTSGASY